MEKAKIERINYLARESKVRELTQEEKDEQYALRQEYIAEFRTAMGAQLKNTVVQYPDGSKKRLTELRDEEKEKK